MRKSLLCFFATAVAFAYLPAVDTVGPLTVRMEGPGEITQTGVAVPVSVTLENKSDAPVKGAVRLAVIDKWRIEPAGKVSFTVEGRKSARIGFTVTAAAGSFNAHYPIHAFAEIEGESRVAHPILIVETKFANPPLPELAVQWKTVDLPADRALAFANHAAAAAARPRYCRLDPLARGDARLWRRRRRPPARRCRLDEGRA